MRIVTSGFTDLGVAEAYACWRLRQDVFVVEQNCPYRDLDGRDDEPGTRHVRLLDGDALVGYLRILDDGDVARVGRVVLAPAARGHGGADTLMQAALDEVGDAPSVLDAQAPLAGWYARFGYAACGAEFLEDGIPHVPMVRRAQGGG